MEFALVSRAVGPRAWPSPAPSRFSRRPVTPIAGCSGTSAGAITAALLAAGYSSHEMILAMNEQQDGHSVFKTFMGEPGPFGNEDVRDSVTARLLALRKYFAGSRLA